MLEPSIRFAIAVIETQKNCIPTPQKRVHEISHYVKRFHAFLRLIIHVLLTEIEVTKEF